jgi:glucose-1-phosphate thymidylyltransferase
VEDPRQFGVVTLDPKGAINGMVEKPKEFVSNLAIIGIYYLKKGEDLRAEIKHLIDNNLKEKGEFQLTNALDALKNKGARLMPGRVTAWMDCGNKDAVLDTLKQTLEFDYSRSLPLISADLRQKNSLIVPPCHIGENVVLENTVVGPFVSIWNNTTVKNSVLSMSLIQDNCRIENAVLANSMTGTHVVVENAAGNLDIGDFSRIKTE